VVSTAPGFTEILFALGAGDQVAAVSDYCRHPEEVQSKPRIGGPFNLNYEQVVALRSDLVVLPQSLSGAAVKLKTLGIPSVQLPNETVADLLLSIERLGALTGREDRAAALRGEIARELDRAIAGPEANKVRALIVVFRAEASLEDLTVASSETFLSELLQLAGGENVIGRTLSRYPRVSREEVIALDPEVVLDLTFTAGNEDTHSIWSALPTLRAVREGRVVAIPDPAITVPGPRMPASLDRFREALRPRSEGK
jgi:iron complex transport system substrate-binding protein